MMVCERCRLRVEVTLIAHSNGSNSPPLPPSWKVLVELDTETHETVDDFVCFIVDHIGESTDSIVRTNVFIDGFTVPLDQRTTIFRDNDMVDIRLEAAPPAPLKECSKSKKRADKRKRTKKSKQVAKEVTKEVIKEVRAPARRERSISSSSSSSGSSDSDSDHSGSTGGERRRHTVAVVTAASNNAAAVVPKAAVVSAAVAGQQPMDVQSLWAYMRSQQTASAADEQAKAAGLQTPAPRVYEEEEEDYYDEEGEYEDEGEEVFESEGEQEEDEGSVDGRRFRDVRSTSSLHNGDTVRFHLLHLDDTSRAPVLSSWVTGTVQMADGNRLQISTSQGVGVWKRDDLFDLQVHAAKDYEEDPLNSSLLLTEGEVEEEGDEVDQDESLLTADIADLLALKRQRLL